MGKPQCCLEARGAAGCVPAGVLRVAHSATRLDLRSLPGGRVSSSTDAGSNPPRATSTRRALEVRAESGGDGAGDCGDLGFGPAVALDFDVCEALNPVLQT